MSAPSSAASTSSYGSKPSMAPPTARRTVAPGVGRAATAASAMAWRRRRAPAPRSRRRCRPPRRAVRCQLIVVSRKPPRWHAAHTSANSARLPHRSATAAPATPPPAQRAHELVGVGVQLAEGAVAVLADDREPVGQLLRPVAHQSCRAPSRWTSRRIGLGSRRGVGHCTPLLAGGSRRRVKLPRPSAEGFRWRVSAAVTVLLLILHATSGMSAAISVT